MGFRIPQIITILFSFVFFLKAVGGPFHIMSVAIPIGLIVILSLAYNFNINILLNNFLFIFLFLLFILYLYLGAFYSKAPNYGQEKTFTLTMFVLMAVVSGRYIISNFNLFLKSNLVFFIVFIIAYFVFYGSFGNVLGMLTQGWQAREEMGGETFAVIGVSRYVGFNLIGLFFLFFYQITRIRFRGIIFGLLFSVGFFIMILFGSKGPILSLLLAPLLFILFHQKINFKKAFILTVAVVGFGFLLLYPEDIVSIIPNKYQAYFEYRFFNYENYMSGGRPSLIQLAITDINEKSLLFGKGTGNYGFLFGHKDMQMYPHNIFVELLYENGLMGLVLFIAILFSYLFRKNFIKDFWGIGTYLIVISYYYLLNAQVSGDLASNFGLFVFLILKYYQVFYEKELFQLSHIVYRSANF